MTTENLSFSVIIPTFNRCEKLIRSLNSLLNQTYQNFEVIIVDDGSTDGTQEMLNNFQPETGFRLQMTIINHDKRQERIASRNDGMLAAKGDWICWLDSDDEYMSNYLEIIKDAAETYPNFDLFNFGSVIHIHRNNTEFATKIGNVFEPALNEDKTGHVSFKSGQIGTGRFVFKRKLITEVGLPKPSVHPYGNPGCFPELNRIPEYPMREDGQWIPFGNPWGDDYWYFYTYTRQHISMPLHMALYIENRR